MGIRKTFFTDADIGVEVAVVIEMIERGSAETAIGIVIETGIVDVEEMMTEEVCAVLLMNMPLL